MLLLLEHEPRRRCVPRCAVTPQHKLKRTQPVGDAATCIPFRFRLRLSGFSLAHFSERSPFSSSTGFRSNESLVYAVRVGYAAASVRSR
eukprot:1628190-Prymnesium_polylepis.2